VSQCAVCKSLTLCWDTLSSPMLDSPTAAIHQFYNHADVQKALNIPNPPVSWVECMPGAGRRRRLSHHHHIPLLPGQLLLDHDRPISVVPYVADLLDHTDVRVLVYNGDRDMTTNAQGSEMLLDSMDWDGAEGWASDYERGLWFPDTATPPDPLSPASHHPTSHTFGGYMKRYHNLDFLIVYNSGHLVPFNQDKIALDLVTRFLGNRTFLDRPLPRFHVEPRPRKNPTKHDTLQESVEDPDAVLLPVASPATAKAVLSQSNAALQSTIDWAVVLAMGGCCFILGFLASRLFPRRHDNYQAIPDHDK
jgi:Serine carboxypeptidase